LAGVGLIAAWALGRVLTDRFLAAQFLWWIPTHVVLAGVPLAVAASWLITPRPNPLSGERAVRTAGRRSRLAAAAALVIPCAHAVIDWRLLARPPEPPAPGAPTLRVTFWNPSWGDVPGLSAEVRRADADLFVVGDQPTDVPWGEILEDLGPRRSALWVMNSVVLARHPLLRWGATSLEIEGVRPQHRRHDTGTPRVFRQRGRAYWVQLDTAEPAGRPVTVWVVDMPSDPLLERWSAGQQAHRAISGWRGPAFIRTPEGRDVPDPAQMNGFPPPDLIVGDFNTTRGARSLEAMTLGLPNAFDAAGGGPTGSFPRELPLWHIDLAFFGPGVRPLAYRLRDAGEGRHWSQTIDFEVLGVTGEPRR
jgi:hypothetical protein